MRSERICFSFKKGNKKRCLNMCGSKIKNVKKYFK